MKSGTQEYRSLHTWVGRNKQKSGYCSHCLEQKTTDWANISGEYFKNLEDYIELCRKCHKVFDSDPYCKNGHLLTPDNIRGEPNRRRCRICTNDRWRLNYHRKKSG